MKLKLRSLLIAGNFILYIFNTSNSGAQWVHQNVPKDIGLILTIDLIDSQNGSGGGWILQNNFYGRAVYTTNGGSNWLLSQVPDSARSLVSIQFVNSSTGYCAGAYNWLFDNNVSLSKNVNSQTGQLNYDLLKKNSPETGENYKGLFFKTNNAGQTWNTYGDLPDNVYYLKGLHFINSSTGFVTAAYNVFGGVDDGVLKTTNGGMNWIVLPMPDTVNSLRNIYFIDSNTGFAVGHKVYMDTILNAVVLKTSNGGSSWIIQNFPSAPSFNDINFIDSNTGFVTGSDGDYIFPSGSVIFKTTNSGLTWLQIPVQLKDIHLYGIRFVQGTGIGLIYGQINFSSVFAAFISKTTNYGQSWVFNPISNPANNIITGCKLLDQNNWYLSGGNLPQALVLHSTNGGVNIKSISNIVPNDFLLHQNYPNPFNPVTKINYELRVTNYVSLKVYDVLGKEVSLLVDKKLNAGKYSVEFDGNNFPGGVYFYELVAGTAGEAGNFTETRKMFLLK